MSTPSSRDFDPSGILKKNCKVLWRGAAKKDEKPKFSCEEEVDKVIEVARDYNYFCACLVGDDKKRIEAIIDALILTWSPDGPFPILDGYVLLFLDLDRIFRRHADGKNIIKEIAATLKALHKETQIILVKDIDRLIKGTKTRICEVLYKAIGKEQIKCLGTISGNGFKDRIESSPIVLRRFHRIDVKAVKDHAVKLSDASAKEESMTCGTRDDSHVAGYNMERAFGLTPSSLEGIGHHDDDHEMGEEKESASLEKQGENKGDQDDSRLHTQEHHVDGGGNEGQISDTSANDDDGPHSALLLGIFDDHVWTFAKESVSSKYKDEGATIYISCLDYIGMDFSFLRDLRRSLVEKKGAVDQDNNKSNRVIFIENCEYLNIRDQEILIKVLEGKQIGTYHGLESIDLSKVTIICTSGVGSRHYRRAFAKKGKLTSEEIDEVEEKMKICFKKGVSSRLFQCFREVLFNVWDGEKDAIEKRNVGNEASNKKRKYSHDSLKEAEMSARSQIKNDYFELGEWFLNLMSTMFSTKEKFQDGTVEVTASSSDGDLTIKCPRDLMVKVAQGKDNEGK